ncbi:MAG: hypothetical protein JKY37_07860 [Nannocystaceae bacterium]|nr:hypothetical protein [Nannocystaceae bacterium]
MTHLRASLISAFTLTLAAGCTAESNDDAVDFRGYQGNGDLTIFMGTSSEDDCDIWDFLGSGVQGGGASGADGEPLLSLANGLVFDGAGNATCEIYGGSAMRLRDLQTGEVLMTASQVFLIDGDFDSASGIENWEAADYTFRDHQIREGGWWGEPIITADAHFEWTHGYRQLLIGALIEGLCGAPGLDAVPEPTPAAHPEG